LDFGLDIVDGIRRLNLARIEDISDGDWARSGISYLKGDGLPSEAYEATDVSTPVPQLLKDHGREASYVLTKICMTWEESGSWTGVSQREYEPVCPTSAKMESSTVNRKTVQSRDREISISAAVAC
jgi:hypothetical protein